MRPNIDLDWQIHGAVREFAEDHDLTLDEAYGELLRQSAAYDATELDELRQRVDRLEAVLTDDGRCRQ